MTYSKCQHKYWCKLLKCYFISAELWGSKTLSCFFYSLLLFKDSTFSPYCLSYVFPVYPILHFSLVRRIKIKNEMKVDGYVWCNQKSCLLGRKTEKHLPNAMMILPMFLNFRISKTALVFKSLKVAWPLWKYKSGWISNVSNLCK